MIRHYIPLITLITSGCLAPPISMIEDDDITGATSDDDDSTSDPTAMIGTFEYYEYPDDVWGTDDPDEAFGEIAFINPTKLNYLETYFGTDMPDTCVANFAPPAIEVRQDTDVRTLHVESGTGSEHILSSEEDGWFSDNFLSGNPDTGMPLSTAYSIVNTESTISDPDFSWTDDGINNFVTMPGSVGSSDDPFSQGAQGDVPFWRPSDTIFTWNIGDDTDYMVVSLTAFSGYNLTCLLTNDGGFAIPPEYIDSDGDGITEGLPWEPKDEDGYATMAYTVALGKVRMGKPVPMFDGEQVGKTQVAGISWIVGRFYTDI